MPGGRPDLNPEVQSSSVAVTHASDAYTCSFSVRRDRDYAPTRPAEADADVPQSADDGQPAEVRLAVSADACGALGCRETDVLYRVDNTEGETRTLCPDHARRWARR